MNDPADLVGARLLQAQMTDWQLAEPTIYAVCAELDVTPIGLLTTDRHAPLPQARQLVAWLLYRQHNWTTPRIASLLDKNVSTVLYYVRNVDRRYRQEWEMIDRCSRLKVVSGVR